MLKIATLKMTKTKANDSNSNPENKRRGKVPKKINETYLHNAGLYYLERYAASSNHFRTVMLRKVKRSCMHHTDQNYDECAKLVNDLIRKFEASGLLNDDLYISSAVASFRRKGISKRMIVQKLIMKGVDAETAQTYLSNHDRNQHEGSAEAELKAAAIFCRKKKLGCFASANTPDTDKQLAKLARAGFSFDTAKKVLNLKEDELQSIIYG